jgi:hypothetical protein
MIQKKNRSNAEQQFFVFILAGKGFITRRLFCEVRAISIALLNSDPMSEDCSQSTHCGCEAVGVHLPVCIGLLSSFADASQVEV